MMNSCAYTIIDSTQIFVKKIKESITITYCKQNKQFQHKIPYKVFRYHKLQLLEVHHNMNSHICVCM